MDSKERLNSGNPAALLPIGVFLVLYLGLGIIFEYVLDIDQGFYQVPAIVIFLIALFVACLQNRKLDFNAKLKGLDYDPNKKLYEALQNVTLQDITNFEKQNIVGKPYRMVILGNEKDLDMKSLEKIAPIKRLSQEEIFGF